MKVITKVVIKIKSGKQIQCEYYNYDGPIAHCGKGGGTTHTTATTTGEIDYEYNSRMAKIAEDQQAIANEYAEFWRTEYKPLESAQIAANISMIPTQTRAARAQLGLETAQARAQEALIPEETAAARARLGLEREAAVGERSLIGARVGAERQRLENIRQEQMAARPVIGEFYKQALRGVDPRERAARARADVAAGFEGAEAAERRSLGRLGMAGRARTEGAMRERFMEQARATAFATTGARERAEQESFQRIAGAVGQSKMGLGGA